MAEVRPHTHCDAEHPRSFAFEVVPDDDVPEDVRAFIAEMEAEVAAAQARQLAN